MQKDLEGSKSSGRYFTVKYYSMGRREHALSSHCSVLNTSKLLLHRTAVESVQGGIRVDTGDVLGHTFQREPLYEQRRHLRI